MDILAGLDKNVFKRIFLFLIIIVPLFISSSRVAVALNPNQPLYTLPSPSPYPYPTPSLVPQSKADYELLGIYDRLQKGQMKPIEALLLVPLLSIPLPQSVFPNEARLVVFNSLMSIPAIANIELTPWQIVIITRFGPLIFTFLLILSVILLIKLIRNGLYIPPIFLKPFIKQPEATFLELTFPAHTEKSAYATEQLYKLLHKISRQHTRSGWLKQKNVYSLEIVSTKTKGIRYILKVSTREASIIRKSLMSYLPGIKIVEVEDYYPDISNPSRKTRLLHVIGVQELKQSGHFALPLQEQKALSQHDPISFLMGNMTKLVEHELVAIQFVVAPVTYELHRNVIKEAKDLMNRIYNQKPLVGTLQKQSLRLPSLWWLLLGPYVWIGILLVKLGLHFIKYEPNSDPQILNNPYEREFLATVKEKLNQPLFEVSIRISVRAEDDHKFDNRIDGLLAAFASFSTAYQGLVGLYSRWPWENADYQINHFKARSLSIGLFKNLNSILSISELTDLYHFPYSSGEDVQKILSPELPAPLSLKQTEPLDIVFGRNTYGGEITDIGLTKENREKHTYILGETGSGKTTVIYHMAKQDIANGKGVAVVDPHGDLSEDLLATVPEDRINDCVYINPIDLKYPVGINLLDLASYDDPDDQELEKELVCESVISIFRRIFSQEEVSNAHRIEYILRNTIYTAFTVKDCTIFTVYDLLNNPTFQKKVVKTLEDENLKNFWRNEFGKAGNYQVVKMVGGVTAKVGRFLFSPTAKRILEQPKSTVNFDEVLNSGKILICNLAEGKLGEDTSQLLGTTILAKIQQAAFRRARQNVSVRKPFYLYVDEFQNFATTSFTRILSGGRKFGLRIIMAEQSTSQQQDRRIVNTILANAGIVICFRSASPVDEELMLVQFAPTVKKGDIANLPRYRFFIRISSVNPEEPFSGETLKIDAVKDQDKIDGIIAASRRNYAITYKAPQKIQQSTETKKKPSKKTYEKPAEIGGLV